MKLLVFITLMLAAALTDTLGQDVTIFPKGEQAPNVNHVGVVWRSQLVQSDSVFTFGISEVAYEPGARLNWHSHPAGQVLLITNGTGYYQEKGKPKLTVRKGDIVICQPGVEHWHGATPLSGLTYIATTPAQKGPTIWLQKVSDEEYGIKE
ncbi:cupin domain-containing protein [Mariniradius sediminis]|uniref:Cupin domain-containing protein n=1 Tax=Mariniradius sediminis TaxID=2909237 RepID=A0ABS9BWQ3_9BACT|nr:cupin domain-containing protein [Mariniradius sediminis]MCF1751596.1 cupin domain-containing protein [Mariniradius sediminis]